MGLGEGKVGQIQSALFGLGFPGGLVVNNLLCDTRNICLTPGPGGRGPTRRGATKPVHHTYSHLESMLCKRRSYCKEKPAGRAAPT